VTATNAKTVASTKRQPNRWPSILDAAASQFAERGYHATSMRDLAAATAMTAGAIYFHVASKQALLLAVYEEGIQRILDRVEAAAAGERERQVGPSDRARIAGAAARVGIAAAPGRSAS
jgi:AcrR family transcriptional regulator